MGPLDYAGTPDREWAPEDVAVTVPRALRPAMFRAARDAADRLVHDEARARTRAEKEAAYRREHQEDAFAFMFAGDPAVRERDAQQRAADFAAALALADAIIGHPSMPDVPGWWEHRVREAIASEHRREAE